MITLDRVIAFTAFLIATAAAYFSVTGIGKLFAGAAFSAMAMAAVLEMGKLVSVSFLYRNWKQIPKALKFYMTVGSVVLILITSAGIYGFLTAAYQKTADQLSIIDKQTQVIEMKKQRFQDELTSSLQERERINSTIQDLNRGLSTNVQQYRDQATGQILTTTSAANRQALERQVQAATQERLRLTNRIEQLTDSVTSFDVQVIDISSSNELAAEIGPLKFIAELTNIELNKIVNWFVLLIVFVFDPLSISLVLAYNFLKVKQQEQSIEPVILENKITDLPVLNEPPPVDGSLVVAEESELAENIEIKESTDLQSLFNANLPYYMEADFDWNKDMRWRTDPAAVNFKKFLDGNRR
jgi:hypothetical protein